MQLIGSHDYLKAVQSDDNSKEETLLDWLTFFFFLQMKAHRFSHV